MKKIICIILSLFVFSAVNAQSIDEILGKFDQLNDDSDKTELTQNLTSLTSAVEKEANDGEGQFKKQLLGQVGNIKNIIPMVTGGTAKGGVIQKLIQTIKMLVGANRVSKMLGGGSLLGKGAGLAGNLNMMKAGASLFGEKESSGFTSLIGNIAGSTSKLDGGGMAAKAAETALKPQLGNLMGMVGKLMP
jgi:hypothetical protein